MQIATKEANAAENNGTAQDSLNFKKDLFPQQTLFMSLKLLIIVCQNCESAGTMQTIKEVLPVEILDKYFNVDFCKETKLSEIGMYLKSLIYKEQPTNASASEE